MAGLLSRTTARCVMFFFEIVAVCHTVFTGNSMKTVIAVRYIPASADFLFVVHAVTSVDFVDDRQRTRYLELDEVLKYLQEHAADREVWDMADQGMSLR